MFHDRRLLDALVHRFGSAGMEEAIAGLRSLIAAGIHPAGSRGWRLTSASADELGRELLGGAGAVMRAGARAPLGPIRAHQRVRVHVTTSCLVTLELWMPFATLSCGSWPVRGPGSTTVDLVPNEPLEGAEVVRPEDFGVVVAWGREGEFPAWITFGA